MITQRNSNKSKLQSRSKNYNCLWNFPYLGNLFSLVYRAPETQVVSCKYFYDLTKVDESSTLF